MSSQVIVSKSALRHNLRAYGRALGDTWLMAVVKANAYGHGMTGTALSIERDTDWFGVVSGEEALQLRRAGIKKPILVLSFYEEEQIAELVKNNVALAVYDLRQVRAIATAAKKLKKIANLHLKVDTGTSRLGISPVELIKFVEEILRNQSLKLQGVFSHFAASEDSPPFTQKQNETFSAVLEELMWRGIDPLAHIACTAAGIVAPNSRHCLVRLGIGLYGLWPSETARKQAKFALKPSLIWQTRIIQVKDLPRGANVGYGLSFTTKRQTKLAVLPIGYADGYDRRLSNVGEVAIRGQRCKVLGRVCMNLTMIDVTDVKGVKVGDTVELIGPTITADEIAKKISTINYEVVARINPSIERIYR